MNRVDDKINWLWVEEQHRQWKTVDLRPYNMEAALYVDDGGIVRAYFDTHGEEREWKLKTVALALDYGWELICDPTPCNN